MKTTRIMMVGAVAGLLVCWAVASEAQQSAPAAPPCGLGQGMGQGAGKNLSPEQRAERQQLMQAYLAELRQKKANNTITAEEDACLSRMEERGGVCINGVPRGPRGGFGAPGQGQGKGMGQGKGQGFRGGRGPGGQGQGQCPNRGANPNCPFANPQPGK